MQITYDNIQQSHAKYENTEEKLARVKVTSFVNPWSGKVKVIIFNDK